MVETAVKLTVKGTTKARLNPTHVFVVGLLAIPSLVFQTSLPLKWLHILLFMLLSAAAGKRVRLLPNIVMITGIVGANLITPVGRVLLSVAGLPITLGALQNGLDRAALLIGMIYISRFSIRKGFCLPGKVGALLSLVFFYLERILEGERLSRGKLLEKIDERIIAVHQSAGEYMPASGDRPPEQTSAKGYLYLAMVVLLSWGLFAYPHLNALL